jgi:hypothetical protein
MCDSAWFSAIITQFYAAVCTCSRGTPRVRILYSGSVYIAMLSAARDFGPTHACNLHKARVRVRGAWKIYI